MHIKKGGVYTKKDKISLQIIKNRIILSGNNVVIFKSVIINEKHI